VAAELDRSSVAWQRDKPCKVQQIKRYLGGAFGDLLLEEHADGRQETRVQHHQRSGCLRERLEKVVSR
jgi:hypothetical protein